jgi:ribosomal protein S13
MKAETKAKRRVTLSIVGLGWTDESEVDSIPGAQAVRVDPETGEILSPSPQPAPEEKENGVATGKQLKLLAVLMEKVGLGREEAHRYVSALLGRQISSAKDLSKEEASRVIDHLQQVAGWFDAMEVPEDLRREVMTDAAQHGDVFDSQETLQAVLEGYKAM